MKKAFVKFIDDKSFSLDERWQIYNLYAEEFYPGIENWIIHMESFDVSKYFRDSVSGRGAVVDLLNCIDDKNWELNKFELDEDEEEDFNRDFISRENFDKIREEIIAKRYTKFCFDW